jgi:SWI/SNF-related matrix-associated actin-dependent regulator 1 of chromatin subfamily A
MPSTRELMLRLPTPPYGDYQITGVRFIQRTGGRCLVGDDMGLGKTYQTVAYAHLNPDALPMLVVCPASLKFNWQRELLKHGNIRSEVAEGRTAYRLKSKVWIINYDLLHDWTSLLLSVGFETVVYDESQRLINPGAKRTKAARIIASRCERVIGLSGSPIKSRPIEFFPILHMIDPKGYPSRHNFGFRYCAPKRGYKGHWEFKGASNLDELHERLKSVMIRRRKQDVLKDLPVTQRTVIPVIPENLKEYNHAEDEFVEWVLEHKGVRAAQKAMKAELIIKLHELKRIAGRGKVKTVLEWARDFHESTGEKLVLFAVQRLITAALHDGLRGSVMIRGDVNARDRQRAMDKFQSDPAIKYIVGNIDAMGEGVTLTAASTVVFCEIGWTPSDVSQPEARVSRIGQKSKHIESFIFIAKNTVDERVWDMIEGKIDVVDRILDGEGAEKVSTRIAEDLVQARSSRRAG